MALNGVPPDAFFFETAIGHCMRTTRVGDCFYYYEEMARRGMQPRPRLKGHLVSVLARAGRMEAARKVRARMCLCTCCPAETESMVVVLACAAVGRRTCLCF